MAAIIGKRKSPRQQHNVQRVPKTRNRYDFWYLAQPWNWEYSQEDRDEGGSGWLPVLGRLNLIAGANGVGPHGELDLALAAARRRGQVPIDPVDPRLGEYQNYTQTFPSHGTTPVWASIFETVKVIGHRASWKFDEERFRRFRRHLVEMEIVPDIDEEVRDALIDTARERLEMRRGRLMANPNNPALALRIENEEKLVEAMQAAPVDPPAPPPKPRKRRAAKKPVAS